MQQRIFLFVTILFLLLSYGCFSPRNLLVNAARDGNVERLRDSLRINVDQDKDNLIEALLVATSRGHMDIVQALASAGTDINGRINKEVVNGQKVYIQSSALFIATVEGNLELCNYFLDKDADIYLEGTVYPEGSDKDDVPVKKAITPLAASAERGYKEIVEILIPEYQKKGSYEIIFIDAIERAARARFPEIIDMFIESGSDIQLVYDALRQQTDNNSAIEIIKDRSIRKITELKPYHDAVESCLVVHRASETERSKEQYENYNEDLKKLAKQCGSSLKESCKELIGKDVSYKERKKRTEYCREREEICCSSCSQLGQLGDPYSCYSPQSVIGAFPSPKDKSY